MAFSLEPVFAPAAWGESTARQGVNLVVPSTTVGALVHLVACEFCVPDPSPRPVLRDPAVWFSSLTAWRAEVDAKAAVVGQVALLTSPARRRVLLGLELGFRLDDGGGWVRFVGPRGKRARAEVADAFAAVLSGTLESA